MKLYCLVENNMFVAGPVPILSPELSNLSDEELLSHGWRIALPRKFNVQFVVELAL